MVSGVAQRRMVMASAMSEPFELGGCRPGSRRQASLSRPADGPSAAILAIYHRLLCIMHIIEHAAHVKLKRAKYAYVASRVSSL